MNQLMDWQQSMAEKQNGLAPGRRWLLAGGVLIVSTGTLVATMALKDTRAATSPATAAPEVFVKTLVPENVRIWANFSGRLSAVDEALVRPEVGGKIVEVRVRDGQTVKAGDVMFVIDPRPYEAAVARARADLASARARAEFAAAERERARGLIDAEAIPLSLHDQRTNEDRMAKAAVLAAEATLRQADINLDYANVKAPIGGRISRAEVTLGNLVQPGANAPVLTRIVSNNGIYADFDVDEQAYVQSIRRHAGTHNEEQHIPVEMRVQGDTERIYQGVIYTFDNKIDSRSGTIRARARFENRDGALVPGMFVSIGLAGSDAASALVVPDVALGSDQSKRFVYVVGRDNKVAYREVALGAGLDGRHVVTSGLKPGERVVARGLQFVKPEVTVMPKELAEGEVKTAAATAARGAE
ncbi:efflux RND transporter periplasmic adaptor subunit [Cupriavidus lacunae]|uniref:Efflux transporter periplasmic adaptor subunit n=1 Tax=Cupriavidus lacunae TaxID=2666307 RepID=A0A370NTE8_9BURK|nr:efflux RND transporter periplasmic adaptor subunit [Cupriavidus lacunae]RDK08880.1 efflux transporter periplasmic adaptor subunit [Cupriavidus lacunae]